MRDTTPVSAVLHRVIRHDGSHGGYAHFCPACDEMHQIWPNWTFDGDVEKPTFAPSVRITGKQSVVVNGQWTGEYKLDENGKALDYCCHYNLVKGVLEYCPDCTHGMGNQKVYLPVIPEWAKL